MHSKTIVGEIYKNQGRHIEFNAQKLQVYNLGCGKQRYDGVTGVDILTTPGADIVHNLDQTPWPIKDSSADILMLFHTLEHLENLPQIMEEMYRVLKPGGRVIIEVPYFRHVGAFQDPTHKHFFTSQTIAYFCEASPGAKPPGPLYANVKFKQIDFWFGWPAKSKNPIVQVIKNLCRHFHNFYDKTLSIVLPVKIIVYEIEAVK